MRFEGEFRVAGRPDEVLDRFSDIERMVRCMPGAQIEGRADDDPTAVQRRLRAYREQTAPVLDWYEARGGVTRIHAIGTVDAVADRARQALGR